MYSAAINLHIMPHSFEIPGGNFSINLLSASDISKLIVEHPETDQLAVCPLEIEEKIPKIYYLALQRRNPFLGIRGDLYVTEVELLRFERLVTETRNKLGRTINIDRI